VGADALRGWLAEYLPWIVWALLALWAPPAAFTIAVDLGLITDAGSGFARLTDVPFVLTLLQLALMAASLPGLLERRAWGWRLQAAAAAAWAGHVGWQIQSGLRLTGAATLRSREAWLAVGFLGIYCLILLGVRRHFAAPRTERGGIAAGGPGRVP
jgi:hypothetical protein